MHGTVIFGGTAEGREAAARMREAGERFVVCVTSEYAKSLLPEGTPCHVGALDERAMLAFLKEMSPARVIDATHPYAARATKNIRACCEALRLPYERIERPVSEGAWRQDVEHVKDSEGAARALLHTGGNILLTTGSRTLSVYTSLVDPARLWARVLATGEALALCEAAGIPPAHIIAMQGPFSAAFNAALYDMLDIRAMVSKDSGEKGGVAEKVIPALERDIHVILIDRPREE